MFLIKTTVQFALAIILFSASDTQKKEKLYGAIDDLKARFGEGIVTKGNLIK